MGKGVAVVELYGLLITREQLLARVGDVAQVGGVRLAELADGAERGGRVADFRTGSGLSFTVHIDRGLDIGALEFCGEALAWRPGVGTPAYCPQGRGGGAMTTCGLGDAGDGDGRAPGLHGPAAHTPAQNVLADGLWEGDRYEMFVEGRVRAGAPFGDRLELRRRISAWLGESQLTVHDRVTNVGGTAAPHTIIYHCSLGFPVLDDEAELIVPSRQVIPRDEVARAGLERYNRFERPQARYAEQVYYHEVAADGGGMATVALVNHRASVGRGLGVYIRYRQRELPWLVECKMMGFGDYLLGLAPANGWPGDRETLQLLEAGETREYRLEIGVLPDNGAIEALEQAMQQTHPEWARRRE